jgi:hypothetical protein
VQVLASKGFIERSGLGHLKGLRNQRNKCEFEHGIVAVKAAGDHFEKQYGVVLSSLGKYFGEAGFKELLGKFEFPVLKSE